MYLTVLECYSILVVYYLLKHCVVKFSKVFFILNVIYSCFLSTDEIDYSAPPSSIVFAPSSAPHQTECVDVYIINDVILEDVETFHLEITTTVPRVSITQSTATVRVYDEDSVEVSLVEDVIRVPEEMEGGEVDVCVIRTGVIEKAVVVQLSTQPQTALGKPCHYTHACIHT